MDEENQGIIIDSVGGYDYKKEFLYCMGPPPETNPYEYKPTDRKFCGCRLESVKNIKYKGELIPEGLYCPRCRKLYKPVTPIKKEEQKEEVAEDKKTARREVSFILPGAVLYVGKGTDQCKKENHHIESVTGILETAEGKPVKINVNYCEEEAVYFISTDDFMVYQKKYKALRGRYLFTYFLEQSRSSGGFDSLEPESMLHAYGYNVSSQNGLTETSRHNILAGLMNFGLMRKYEILKYLDLFIETRQDQYNMQAACQKWENDREWVREYKIDEQRKVDFTLKGIDPLQI